MIGQSILDRYKGTTRVVLGRPRTVDRPFAMPPNTTEVVAGDPAGGVYRRSGARSLVLQFNRRPGLAVGGAAVAIGSILLAVRVVAGAYEWGWSVLVPLTIFAVLGLAMVGNARGSAFSLSVDGLRSACPRRRLYLAVAELASFATVEVQQKYGVIGYSDALGSQTVTSWFLIVRTTDGRERTLRQVRTPEHGWALEQRLNATLAALPR